tara:strand:+ start:6334 stop:7044 length:711 start_codon:yes stop_codon:yes gene_type:complete
MKRILKKDLKALFVSEVLKNGGICGNDNPFRLVMGENEYFIFIKNISPAYYVNSPNITRVQLPVSKRFNEVITSNLVFLILGYDMENDVFVSWDPHKVKQRLNKKSNISLFSRLNLQSEVISNEIKVGYLSNGDKIILFKRDNLNVFLTDLKNFYDKSLEGVSTKKAVFNQDLKVEKNDFKEMGEIIEPFLSNFEFLLALKTLGEKYKNHNKYGKFKLNDWRKIINELDEQRKSSK